MAGQTFVIVKLDGDVQSVEMPLDAIYWELKRPPIAMAHAAVDDGMRFFKEMTVDEWRTLTQADEEVQH